MPAVSVIIPAYNAEAVLEDAVESVRRQTYTDYEVIVADDGSTDATAAVADRLAEGFENLRVLHLPHAGLAATRNRAIAEMTGNTIALLDADDLWRPTKLQRCMDYLQEHDGDRKIVYTPMAPVRMDGTAMTGHSKPCKEGWLTEALFHSIFIHDPAVVFRREVFDTCGGFDEGLGVCIGHEYWLRVSTQFAFGLIDEPLALRRWSETSLTRGNRSRARKTKAFVLRRFYHDRGGAEMLATKPAHRRLAKVCLQAGRILLKQGQFVEARQHLAAAIGYRRGYLKAWPLYLTAATLSLGR